MALAMHVKHDSAYLLSIGIPAFPSSAAVTESDVNRLASLNQSHQFWSVLLTHLKDVSPVAEAQCRVPAESQIPRTRKLYISIYVKQLASIRALQNEILGIVDETLPARPSRKFHSLSTAKPP